jgi:hypothetical protein
MVAPMKSKTHASLTHLLQHLDMAEVDDVRATVDHDAGHSVIELQHGQHLSRLIIPHGMNEVLPSPLPKLYDRT